MERNYFAGVQRDEKPFEPILGPLTPTPQLTLEEAVLKAVNAEERWYVMNDGWVS
jgi:hypothetical protein